ncbi:MAG: hypothetical protein JW934_12115 [Anaerolineae bacterium]|nr:hypothetical protein [Anaerolineae bacterium]
MIVHISPPQGYLHRLTPSLYTGNQAHINNIAARLGSSKPSFDRRFPYDFIPSQIAKIHVLVYNVSIPTQSELNGLARSERLLLFVQRS